MLLFSNIYSKFSPSSNKHKVVKNVYWAVIGKIINMLGALFVGILVARYLGPEQYGLMNYVISYVTIFSIFSSFGLDNIEIRELSRQHDRKDYILGTVFRIRLALAAITYILIILTLLAFKADSFTSLMILVYSIIVFSKCFDVIRNYFTSIVQNEYVVKSEISRTIIGACIKIVLLWFKASLSLFIVAATFDTVLVSGGYIVSYQKKIGRLRAWKYDKSLVFFMLKEALPLVLSGMAVIIYQRIDQVMIKNMIDNQSVGHFATAGKFLDLTVFLPTIFTQTITPLLIRKRENDPAEYEIMKQKFVSIVVWTSVIIALMTSVSSYWLVLMTFGNEYLPAVTILQIMAWKTVGTALASSSGQIIIIERIHKWAFIRNLMGVGICIGLNLIFIPKWGIIGSAWVTIITMAFTGCLANIFIPPYYKIMAIQIRALLFGWKEVFSIKRVFA